MTTVGVRRLLVTLLLVLAGAGLLAPGAAAVGEHTAFPTNAAHGPIRVVTQDDADAYAADYRLNADGSVDVTQTITWAFPDGGESHGILRTVTVRAGYQDSQDQYRYYELSEVAVSSPTGAPTDIAITDLGAMKQIRIGSPSQTVSGTQTYVVKFRLAHVVNDIGDGTAEFYYDHVSVSNNYVYRNVTATVTGPAAGTRAACYYGPQGSTTPCTATAGETSTFQVPNLSPGDGASILVSYPRDAFGDLTPDLREGSATATSGSPLSPDQAHAAGLLTMGVGVLLPLIAGGVMGMLVWTRGRDEWFAGLTPGVVPGADQQGTPVVQASRAPTVAVQFTPPAGVQPGLVGTIIDEEAGVLDVTATLIDLAVRGYLTIEPTGQDSIWRKDDWILTLRQPPAGAVPLIGYEQTLISGIFARVDTVRLSDLKNTFASTLKSVQSQMYTEAVVRGWFRRSPQAVRSGFQGFGFALIVLSVILFIFGTGMFAGLFTDSGLPINPGIVLGGGGILAGIIVAFLGHRMAARTAVGSAVLAQSRGFERYLATAEAGQIRWEEAQDIFSRYLPYAIVFGLAERWASVFEQVAAAAAAAGQSIGAPTWYVGAWTADSFSHVAADMDSFSTQAAGTFVSTPGSSGSSGFSSGGGFSGGGGGGSGGGSW